MRSLESSNDTRRVQVIGARPTIAGWLRDLWQFRNVLLALSVRDVRSKYKQAILGIAWAIIQPAVQVAIYSFVFRGIAKIETPVAYPVFVLASLLPFNLFQQIIALGTPAFASSQGIVTKVYFPRIYTVASGSASSFVNAAISLVLLVIVAIAFRAPLGATAILAGPMLIAVALCALGIAAMLSALNARFRDVQHALPLVMTALMYVSPVLYPLDAVPASVRTLAVINPVSGLVEGFRCAVMGVEPSSWWIIWYSVGASALVFVVGVLVFEAMQARSIDVL
jgi:lipopolysaccharide transport system permease protein